MGEWDSLSDIRIIKQTQRQKITLVCNEYGEKYLKREIEGDKREIYKTLKTINCPYIPEIYFVGFNGVTTVIEEFAEGTSLTQIMEKGEKLSKKRAKSIFKKLTAAMEAIHNVNVIHRDIKPDNILLDEKGNIHLIDFDIARIYRPQIRKDTEKMGTFGYAPIEQYGMMPTDFKTDIYSFGVTMCLLMEYCNLKGTYYAVSEKCRKLDPGERYKNAKEIRRRVFIKRLKPLILVPFIILIFVSAVYFVRKPSFFEEVTLTATEEPQEEYTLKEGEYFAGFKDDNTTVEYSQYSNFSSVDIFSMYKEWKRLLFLEDGNKHGKIKLGKGSLIDADITLNKGTLIVKLSDKSGNSFEEDFSYTGQYSYVDNYPANRKNADIICCDWDNDGEYELLLGLNDGAIGVMDNQFYNYFNYCIAWCVKYSEEKGFTLCEGDMFSKGGSFSMAEYTDKFNVSTRFDIGNIKGYYLEGNKIMPSY